jgi:hypothetical protein
VFKFMHVSKDSVIALPVATASPVAAAAEQQQQHDDKQEHVHSIPPCRMRRGGVTLASAILYASLQIQLLAELITNAPGAKKVSKLKSSTKYASCSEVKARSRGEPAFLITRRA